MIRISKQNIFLEYLIYLLFFLLPLQTRWIIRSGSLNGGYSEYATISLYGTDILMILILAMVMFGIKFRISDFGFRISELFRDNKILIMILAVFDLAAFVSIWFAPDTWLAIYKYLLLLMFMVSFFVLRMVKIDRIRMTYAFIAGVVLQAGLSIWQFITQNTFASKWLGMAVHDPITPGTSVVETILGDRYLRAYGGLDHPNMLGALMVIGIIAVVWLIVEDKFDNNRPHPLPHRQAGNHPPFGFRSQQALDKGREIYGRGKLFFYFFIYAILFLALIFSFSRSAWIVFALIMAVYLVYALIRRNEWMIWRSIAIILVSWAILLAVFSMNSSVFMTRFGVDTRLEERSISERSGYLVDAQRMIGKHIFLGTGIGNYGSELAKFHPERPVWNIQPVHNTYLLILSETGFLGLLIFVLFLIYYLFYSARMKGEQVILSIMIISSFVLLMFFDHWLWSLHFGVLLFWTILGLTAHVTHNS